MRPHRGKPHPQILELDRQRDIDEIAGDDDVVGRRRLEMRDDAAERDEVVLEAPVAPPVDEANETLARERGERDARGDGEMRIGQVAEGEHS